MFHNFSAPPRTPHERFRLTRLSSDRLEAQDGCGCPHRAYLPAWASWSPATLRPVMRCYRLRGGASLPRLLWWLRRHRFAPVGDPVFRSCRTSEHAVGSPLIALPDRIGQCPWGRDCLGREPIPRHSRVPVSDAIPAGAGDPDWRLGFKQSSLYPITRVLRRIVLGVFGRSPLSRHAVVPFIFRCQVSR